MKAVIAAVVLVLATLCSPAATAWNCPAGQQRVQAPAGTPTTAPYYDVVEGIAFVCEPIPTTPPPSTSGSSANAASNANSTSTSNSSSQANGGNATSTATGGNQQQKQNQSQTATGGNATGGNASAQGGTATASGNGVGNGNNSNNYSNTTNVSAAAASPYAPPSFSTATCFKGFSGGASAVAGGISFGGGKIDQNCAELEAARQAPNLLVFCEQYVKVKYVKAAGVTLEQCMQPKPVAITVVAPAIVAQAQPIVVNVQPVVVPAPAVNIIVPAAPAPSVVVKPSVKVPRSNNKCVPHECPPQKPVIYREDGNGHIVKELQN
jgi:hypothetical protein